MSDEEVSKRWVCARCGMKDPRNNCSDFALCQDKILYIDGARVWKEQMTEKEREEFYPVDYARRWYTEEYPCPICMERFDCSSKLGLVHHTRHKHPEWYAKHKIEIRDAASVEAFLNDYRGRTDHKAEETPAQ